MFKYIEVRLNYIYHLKINDFILISGLPYSGKEHILVQQIRWTAILIKWSSILFSAATAADSTTTLAPKASAQSVTKKPSRRSSNLRQTCRHLWPKHRHHQSLLKSQVHLLRHQLQLKPLYPLSCFQTRWDVVLYLKRAIIDRSKQIQIKIFLTVPFSLEKTKMGQFRSRFLKSFGMIRMIGQTDVATLNQLTS